jgi:predicted porin
VANGTFSRAANIFLDSASAGRLTLGRQDNAAFQAFNYGDVNAAKNFGSSIIFWNDGSSFGGGATKSGLSSFTGTTFLSNAIRYDTPKFGGFRGTLQHVAGGQANDSTFGNTSASNRTVLTTSYDQGPWGAALGYSTANGATSQENARVISAGVNYTQEKFKLATGYTKFQNPNSTAANSDFDLYQVSGRYNVTNRFSTSVGYYVLGDQVTTANKAKMVSLVGNYSLSKRTELYAGVASTVNDGASGFAPYGGGGGNLNSMNSTQYPSIMQTAGQTQNGYVVGMTHRF